MAFRSVSTSFDTDSGAGLDSLTDMNALTFAGATLGVVTVGGAVALGAIVAPAQVLTGTATAGLMVAAGLNKKENGSYLPSFGKKQEAAPAPATTA